MNKNELITEVAKATSRTKRDTEETITATLEVIQDTLAAGEPIKIIGFGQFAVKEYAARLGRNPKTGEEIHIPPTKKPVFTPGKELRGAVSGK